MFVIKDPRICRLAPLWLQTLAQLDIEPLVVIAVRHPAEVAASLAARDGFDPLMSNLLWLRHVLDAERCTRGIARSVTSFEALMSDWRSTVKKISEDLQIEWPVAPISAATAIEGFLAPEDRHHMATKDCTLPDWVAAAYGLLNEAEKNRNRWDLQHWGRLGGEVDRAAAIFGSYLTTKDNAIHAAGVKVDKLRGELQKTAEEVGALRLEIGMARQTANQQASSIAELTETIRKLNATCDAAGHELEEARNEIVALRNSISWRVTSPLRVIARWLRNSLSMTFSM